MKSRGIHIDNHLSLSWAEAIVDAQNEIEAELEGDRDIMAISSHVSTAIAARVACRYLMNLRHERFGQLARYDNSQVVEGKRLEQMEFSYSTPGHDDALLDAYALNRFSAFLEVGDVSIPRQFQEAFTIAEGITPESEDEPTEIDRLVQGMSLEFLIQCVRRWRLEVEEVLPVEFDSVEAMLFGLLPDIPGQDNAEAREVTKEQLSIRDDEWKDIVVVSEQIDYGQIVDHVSDLCERIHNLMPGVERNESFPKLAADTVEGDGEEVA